MRYRWQRSRDLIAHSPLSPRARAHARPSDSYSDENDYLYAKLNKKKDFNPNTMDAWIGATDMRNEGVFSWIGPKHLVNGVKFWEGDENGQAIDGRYTNWAVSSSGAQTEPNANGEEDCVEMRGGGGHWNDKNCYQPNEFFIVEFGTPATDH